MAIRLVEYLRSLVRELAKLPDETEWVEFKCNNKQPQMIGEYISALSNVACIFRKNCASVPEERSAIPLQTEQSSAG